jgi:hypothetical protein
MKQESEVTETETVHVHVYAEDVEADLVYDEDVPLVGIYDEYLQYGFFFEGRWVEIRVPRQ